MIITGQVVQGKHLGRTIGYPTANIQSDSPFTGERGVYAGLFRFYEGEFPCMVNIGSHPTAPEGKPTIEAHLLDYNGDLYDLHVEIELMRFLRPERKFESLDALKEQLNRDRRRTREALSFPEKHDIL